MTDLHGWITQQIDRREADVRSAERDHGRVWAASWHAPTDSFQLLDDHGIVVASDLLPGAVGLLAKHDPAAVLRRCTADRKILSDHTSFGDGSVHCVGCGVDYETGPLVDNVNDCPTLLSLAEGYGLTEEQRAQLDRPEAAPVVARPRGPIPDTSRVPAALRGPNWKRHS